jgi:F-type H+-transporting ATPase subunit delta
MRDPKIASRYATALWATARDAGQTEAIAESYATVRDAVAGNRRLRTFLESPQVTEDEKRELLRGVLTGKVEPLFVHFVLFLIDKNRIEYFRDIGQEYARLVEKEKGFQRATVTTAVSLPADLEESLREKLAQFTGRKIILKKRVDPKVIGGVCVIMGDEIVDGTVRTGLDQLRKQLAEAPLR